MHLYTYDGFLYIVIESTLIYFCKRTSVKCAKIPSYLISKIKARDLTLVTLAPHSANGQALTWNKSNPFLLQSDAQIARKLESGGETLSETVREEARVFQLASFFFLGWTFASFRFLEFYYKLFVINQHITESQWVEDRMYGLVAELSDSFTSWFEYRNGWGKLVKLIWHFYNDKR